MLPDVLWPSVVQARNDEVDKYFTNLLLFLDVLSSYKQHIYHPVGGFPYESVHVLGRFENNRINRLHIYV